MLKFLLWLVLFVLCWTLALLALALWPCLWLLSLPFRVVEIAVEGVFVAPATLPSPPFAALSCGGMGPANGAASSADARIRLRLCSLA